MPARLKKKIFRMKGAMLDKSLLVMFDVPSGTSKPSKVGDMPTIIHEMIIEGS